MNLCSQECRTDSDEQWAYSDEIQLAFWRIGMLSGVGRELALHSVPQLLRPAVRRKQLLVPASVAMAFPVPLRTSSSRRISV